MPGLSDRAKRLWILSLSVGLTLGPVTLASAQSLRNPFSRSSRASRPAPAEYNESSEINRELAEIYRKNGREMPDMDAGPVPPEPAGSGRSPVRMARGESSQQSRSGLFGKLFGRGRSAPEPEEDAEAAPRRGLFRSRSDNEKGIYPPTHKKTGKKESELLDPDDLEPLPSGAGSSSRNSMSTSSRRTPLSAPRSAREGATRREPVGLSPAERDVEPQRQAVPRSRRQEEAPPPRSEIVPPEPIDSDGFFTESRDPADRESLNLGPDDTDAAFESRLKSPPKSETRPDEDSLSLDADDLDSAGDVADDADREVADQDAAAEEPSTELAFESALDSPYSGKSLSTRELESRRVEDPEAPASRLGRPAGQTAKAGTPAVRTENPGPRTRATSLRSDRRVDDEDTLVAPEGLDEELDQPLPPLRPVPPESRPIPKVERREALKPVPPESDASAVPRAPKADDAAATPRNARPVPSAETRGLMGYCVVTLKDTREMVPASAEFRSQFAGKTYEFASSEAKQQFDANPRLYVPGMNGNDIVLLSKGQRGVEGSLEHAAWYRGKLYLFSSAESLKEFAASPAKYVAFP